MSNAPASESEVGATAPETLTPHLRRAFWQGLIIPAGLLLFFALAPHWLEYRLHGEITTGIQQSKRVPEEAKAQEIARYAEVSFEQLCRSERSEDQGLRQGLERAGVAGQFQRLRWSRWLAVAAVALLLGFNAATLGLNHRARRSRSDLISAFRLGWAMSIAVALIQLFLLIPLLGYGLFELTTLAADRFFPQLIAAVVIGGLIALWRSGRVLLKTPPLEFRESMARAVTPTEAPHLWAVVREAAGRLETAPPDHIVIGMQLNFYVTELAVIHDDGRCEGRTLYLSYPLLKQLAPDEVLAIIGHELGHFLGEDTRITREFYPLRTKAGATLYTLAQAGWAGWSSVHVLAFFHWAFGGTEQAMSRERELAADRVAARLTSPIVMARALLRFHVLSEAFRLSFTGDPEQRSETPFDVPLAGYVRDHLTLKPAFWRELFKAHTPHPLDSHPPLHLRLRALHEALTPEQALAIATTETLTAYAVWLDGVDARLFTGITAKATEELERLRWRMKVEQADAGTDAGRKLLEDVFPDVRWRARRSGAIVVGLCCGVGALVCVGIGLVASDPVGRTIFIGLAAIMLVAGVASWRPLRQRELVLRADGLTRTGWKRPLRFAEVASMSSQKTYGAVTVIFSLKEPAPPITRWTLWPFKRRAVSLTLSPFEGKQEETFALIHKYLTRTTE